MIIAATFTGLILLLTLISLTLFSEKAEEPASSLPPKETLFKAVDDGTEDLEVGKVILRVRSKSGAHYDVQLIGRIRDAIPGEGRRIIRTRYGHEMLCDSIFEPYATPITVQNFAKFMVNELSVISADSDKPGVLLASEVESYRILDCVSHKLPAKKLKLVEFES